MQYRARRILSDTLVQVRHDDSDTEVSMRVKDATVSGLKLGGAVDVEADETIQICVRNRCFRARVVWINSHAMGVAFERAVSPSDVQIFTGKRGPAATRKPGRVGFAF